MKFIINVIIIIIIINKEEYWNILLNDYSFKIFKEDENIVSS